MCMHHLRSAACLWQHNSVAHCMGHAMFDFSWNVIWLMLKVLWHIIVKSAFHYLLSCSPDRTECHVLSGSPQLMVQHGPCQDRSTCYCSQLNKTCQQVASQRHAWHQHCANQDEDNFAANRTTSQDTGRVPSDKRASSIWFICAPTLAWHEKRLMLAFLCPQSCLTQPGSVRSSDKLGMYSVLQHRACTLVSM